MNMSRTIWLIEPARLFREALKSLLEGPQFHVTRDVSETGELLKSTDSEVPPDLLVVTIHSELASGTGEETALGQLCHMFPSTPVVVLADTLSVAQLKSAMKAGASGYLLRDIAPAVLKASLQLALSGAKVLPTNLVLLLVSDVGTHTGVKGTEQVDLSLRERDILLCLARGQPNKVIANRLDIAEGTVKVHVKALFKKIRARNRTEAAIWALNHGFNTNDNAPQEHHRIIREGSVKAVTSATTGGSTEP